MSYENKLSLVCLYTNHVLNFISVDNINVTAVSNGVVALKLNDQK